MSGPIKPEVPPERFAALVKTANEIAASIQSLAVQSYNEGVKDGIGLATQIIETTVNRKRSKRL